MLSENNAKNIKYCSVSILWTLLMFLSASFVYGQSQNIQQATLELGGVLCIGCPSGIKKKLQSTPGVLKVKSPAIENEVTVHYNPTVITLEEIIAAINDLGHEATLKISENKGKDGTDG